MAEAAYALLGTEAGRENTLNLAPLIEHQNLQDLEQPFGTTEIWDAVGTQGPGTPTVLLYSSFVLAGVPSSMPSRACFSSFTR
jgi:hypothetical protein